MKIPKRENVAERLRQVNADDSITLKERSIKRHEILKEFLDGLKTRDYPMYRSAIRILYGVEDV